MVNEGRLVTERKTMSQCDFPVRVEARMSCIGQDRLGWEEPGRLRTGRAMYRYILGRNAVGWVGEWVGQGTGCVE